MLYKMAYETYGEAGTSKELNDRISQADGVFEARKTYVDWWNIGNKTRCELSVALYPEQEAEKSQALITITYSPEKEN